MQHFTCGVVSCLVVFAGMSPSNSPSMLELEASLGLLSLHHCLDTSIPLPMLPSPPNYSPILVLASTPLSPSLRSSPSPPTCPYLPPHCHQVRGTRSSPTSSTPSSTLGDVNSRKENSLPYSRHQQATPRNQEQRLSLGTRTKIPTRHMLDTLGVQTTSDSNVPSGQKLGLCHDFRRFSAFFFLSPKRPLI